MACAGFQEDTTAGTDGKLREECIDVWSDRPVWSTAPGLAVHIIYWWDSGDDAWHCLKRHRLALRAPAPGTTGELWLLPSIWHYGRGMDGVFDRRLRGSRLCPGGGRRRAQMRPSPGRWRYWRVALVLLLAGRQLLAQFGVTFVPAGGGRDIGWRYLVIARAVEPNVLRNCPGDRCKPPRLTAQRQSPERPAARFIGLARCPATP